MVSGKLGVGGRPVLRHVGMVGAHGREHVTCTGNLNTGVHVVEVALKQRYVNRLYNVQVSKGSIVTTL